MWGSKSTTASSDSTAPLGLPGRLRIRLRPRVPQRARLRAENLVFLRPSERMSSGIPSTSRSQTARVASGVTSRADIPVPPVVSTSRACAHNVINFCSIACCSSPQRSPGQRLRSCISESSGQRLGRRGLPFAAGARITDGEDGGRKRFSCRGGHLLRPPELPRRLVVLHRASASLPSASLEY